MHTLRKKRVFSVIV